MSYPFVRSSRFTLISMPGSSSTTKTTFRSGKNNVLGLSASCSLWTVTDACTGAGSPLLIGPAQRASYCPMRTITTRKLPGELSRQSFGCWTRCPGRQLRAAGSQASFKNSLDGIRWTGSGQTAVDRLPIELSLTLSQSAQLLTYLTTAACPVKENFAALLSADFRRFGDIKTACAALSAFWDALRSRSSWWMRSSGWNIAATILPASPRWKATISSAAAPKAN